MLPTQVEKALIQAATQALPSEVGIDPGEVNISLIGESLGEKADQKASQGFAMLRYEASPLEMDEKQLGEHIGHMATTPPIVDNGDCPWVIGGFPLTDLGFNHANDP